MIDITDLRGVVGWSQAVVLRFIDNAMREKEKFIRSLVVVEGKWPAVFYQGPWLVVWYRGWNATQLYGDLLWADIRIPKKTNQDNDGMLQGFLQAAKRCRWKDVTLNRCVFFPRNVELAKLLELKEIRILFAK